MDTNRGIWEDEEAFLGLFKGVAKEGGMSSGNFSVYPFWGPLNPKTGIRRNCRNRFNFIFAIDAICCENSYSQSQTLSRLGRRILPRILAGS